MTQKKKKETKDAEGFIEIPFGAFDSETMGWTYTIPEGFTAKIEDGKIIVEKAESDDEKINRAIFKALSKKEARDVLRDEHIEVSDALAYLEKQKEQKPAEWSERDDKWLASAIAHVADSECFDHFYKISKDDVIAWLKSIRPQPHWKPSEEQTRALVAVTKNLFAEMPERHRLESLYNDLKKL